MISYFFWALSFALSFCGIWFNSCAHLIFFQLLFIHLLLPCQERQFWDSLTFRPLLVRCLFLSYVIKQNESELANTVFKIQPYKANSLFCFLLFMQFFNYSYLWNPSPNLHRVFSKLKPKQYLNRKCQKPKNHLFNFWLILLDCITYISWYFVFVYKNKFKFEFEF